MNIEFFVQRETKLIVVKGSHQGFVVAMKPIHIMEKSACMGRKLAVLAKQPFLKNITMFGLFKLSYFIIIFNVKF